ncbi:MAG: hypothetical protein ACT4NP_02260 [Pseudonocardiales bacterium]
MSDTGGRHELVPRELDVTDIAARGNVGDVEFTTCTPDELPATTT